MRLEAKGLFRVVLCSSTKIVELTIFDPVMCQLTRSSLFWMMLCSLFSIIVTLYDSILFWTIFNGIYMKITMFLFNNIICSVWEVVLSWSIWEKNSCLSYLSPLGHWVHTKLGNCGDLFYEQRLTWMSHGWVITSNIYVGCTHPWASCQMHKTVGCACAGNAGNVAPPPRVNDPDMHHRTCVTHVPWYMSGSLNSDFLRSRWRGKRSQHSQRLRNP